MIKRSLIEHIFSAFSIERWNDHPRTQQFTEMDKQSHKAIIAYVIAMDEISKGSRISWDKIIEAGIFEFLHRVLVTDIKPPLFHKLMSNAHQKRQLDDWVLEQLKPSLIPIQNGELFQRFKAYVNGSNDYKPERRILSAAHYMATRWEFGFIYEWSKPIFRIEETKKEIMDEINRHKDIPIINQMLQEMETNSKDGIYGFISLIGQLQFQKRWTQTQRIPQTSVLGHLLMVAILSWLVSLEIGAGEARRRNNFYCGLFHDLPEVFTRDIISPVKKSVEGLNDLLKTVEMTYIHENVFPLIPVEWHKDLLYFVEDEFQNKVVIDGVAHHQEDLSSYEDPKYHPMDGKIVEACDKFSAFVEASQSISLGISSSSLRDGKRFLYEKFAKDKINGFDFGTLFDYYL